MNNKINFRNVGAHFRENFNLAVSLRIIQF